MVVAPDAGQEVVPTDGRHGQVRVGLRPAVVLGPVAPVVAPVRRPEVAVGVPRDVPDVGAPGVVLPSPALVTHERLVAAGRWRRFVAWSAPGRRPGRLPPPRVARGPEVAVGPGAVTEEKEVEGPVTPPTPRPCPGDLLGWEAGRGVRVGTGGLPPEAEGPGVLSLFPPRRPEVLRSALSPTLQPGPGGEPGSR